ncbi:MAG TPA: hypothetical protein VK668_10425 [Mucilaginibacter sp.]|nr:hypothetical protein [Mucilaginibacter sp.]
MRQYIKSDLYRYCGSYSKTQFVKAYFIYPGFRITLFYRLAKYYKKRNFLLFVFFKLFHRRYVIKYGIDLAVDATIGYGFYMGHFGGINISPKAIIGNNCNISQGVTIGISGRGENRGVPEIGDGIYIGPGAKLFGKIKIGNFVAVGANAVVNKSFPDRSVIAGIPAKVISQQGSEEFILNPYDIY